MAGEAPEILVAEPVAYSRQGKHHPDNAERSSQMLFESLIKTGFRYHVALYGSDICRHARELSEIRLNVL